VCLDSFTRPTSPFIYRSIVAANIASRRVANKPSFGGRDLHCRRCERETGKKSRREREDCTLARFTRAYIYDQLQLPPCMHVYIYIYIYIYMCVYDVYMCMHSVVRRVRLEKVLCSRYLFFGSLEPPVMIIGAM